MFDAIIVGLGAMGSAAAFHFACRGKQVLGLDRFRPPHNLGSSHGATRIIREAYFEHPLYVPLVRRAYTLWAELEKRSGRRLLLPTGGLMLGPADGALVKGARRSAEEHHLAHQLLSAGEVRERFPAFRPAEDMVAVWEPRAGILFPELAVQTHLEQAEQAGAVLRFNEPVQGWEALEQGIRVWTESAEYFARRLLLSAGAWMDSMTQGFRLPLTVERQVPCWFKPLSNREYFEPKRFPIYICEYGPRQYFYGFPDLGEGIKAARHHQGEVTRAESVQREAGEEDIQAVRSLLERYLPAGAGRLLSSSVCLYTNTPDEHFVLGPHPHHPQVVLASACSGHGFKFSPVIGEMAAAFLLGETPPFDLSLFRPERLLNPTSDNLATPGNGC